MSKAKRSTGPVAPAPINPSTLAGQAGGASAASVVRHPGGLGDEGAGKPSKLLSPMARRIEHFARIARPVLATLAEDAEDAGIDPTCIDDDESLVNELHRAGARAGIPYKVIEQSSWADIHPALVGARQWRADRAASSDAPPAAAVDPHAIDAPTTAPTAGDLATEAGISDDTFRRVRREAKIDLRLKGAAARNRRYTSKEIDKLRAAALAGNFIERRAMADKWAKWGSK